MSRRAASLLALGGLLVAGAAAGESIGAPASGAVVIPPLGGYATVSESGPRWSSLTPAQREVLEPLQEDWSGIDADRKQKWLELAGRYPLMSRAEQARIRDRMVEWARLTPSQRGEVRRNFQQAARTPSADRQAQWEAYQALPAEEKSRLAGRAADLARASQTVRSAGASTATATATDRSSTPRVPADRMAPLSSTTKSNIVPNPVFATAPRPVGPTVVRSGPGATTTLVTRQPTPPVHQLPGLPKVAATPTLVDQTTLLPQRGPQAAAVIAPSVPPASSEAEGE